MVNFIIGNNATGKTRYLLDMWYSMNASGESCISSFSGSVVNGIIPIEKDMLDIISNELYYNDIIITRNMITAMKGGYEDATPKFFETLSLLSKKVKHIYLDDPSIDMTVVEVRDIAKILNALNRDSDKDIWIVTNSFDMVTICDSHLYCIKDGELRDGSDEYDFLIKVPSEQ